MSLVQAAEGDVVSVERAPSAPDILFWQQPDSITDELGSTTK